MAHIQVWVNVSTHSRAEAAANEQVKIRSYNSVSTHSRAEAAASGKYDPLRISRVSTHSRAEAAALYQKYRAAEYEGFNTQPRGGGCPTRPRYHILKLVSTHSRAEAAAPYIKKQEKSAY